jgi:hypothetical protein
MGSGRAGNTEASLIDLVFSQKRLIIFFDLHGT